jgi:hypothetical protein
MKETRLRIMTISEKLAGEEGFEPSLRDPESRVLPLDDSPKTDVTESKFSPLPGLLNNILSSIVPHGTPQKAVEIGQQIQSLLPYTKQLARRLLISRLEVRVLRGSPKSC